MVPARVVLQATASTAALDLTASAPDAAPAASTPQAASTVIRLFRTAAFRMAPAVVVAVRHAGPAWSAAARPIHACVRRAHVQQGAAMPTAVSRAAFRLAALTVAFAWTAEASPLMCAPHPGIVSAAHATAVARLDNIASMVNASATPSLAAAAV